MGDEEVGSVADEAAKLFGALSSWAQQVDEHIDTGDAECTYCPICRTVHALRETSPEVRAHLATAATSLLQAATGLLAAASTDRRDPSARVEHINLDDPDDPDDPEEQER